MRKLTAKQVREFQKEILQWYVRNRRDLPWRPPSLKLRRDRTVDPYRILVSEVMLQQTQVQRVIPKYESWLKAFPTIRSLAKAKTSEVLKIWSGLGYNRRALYLLRVAQQIIAEFGGKIPTDEKSLRSLPGVGQYTARAILCFAYNKQVAVVDTNIRKVILVHFFSKQPFNFSTRPRKKIKWSERELQTVADQLLPKGRAYDWNHALMDYAASVLAKSKISIKKQSRFLGSNRYYRGRIVKLLLEQPTLSVRELGRYLGSNGEHLHQIIEGLARDGLVRMDGTTVSLSFHNRNVPPHIANDSLLHSASRDDSVVVCS